MAPIPGSSPATTPTIRATTRPIARIDPGKTRFGSILASAAASRGVATTANSSPNNPPNSAMTRDSLNEEQYRAVGISDGLQDRQFGRPLTNRNGHGVPRDQQQRKKNNRADGNNQELNVAELFHPICCKRRLRFGLRFARGVCKLGIDGFSDARSIFRLIDADDIPSDLAFHAIGDFFLEIVPLKPELCLVILRASTVIDADEIELPCPSTI